MTTPTETATYIVALPAGMKLLNANDRVHWRTRARITKALREAAEKSALDAHIPPQERISIQAVLHPHDKRRRDPHNWYPSFKAAIDGVVDAGVIPDDDGKHLISIEVVLGTPVRNTQISLRITPLDGTS